MERRRSAIRTAVVWDAVQAIVQSAPTTGRALSVVYVNRPDQHSFFRVAITEDAGLLAVFATSGAQPDSRERGAESGARPEVT